jgi:hypothetical protein
MRAEDPTVDSTRIRPYVDLVEVRTLGGTHMRDRRRGVSLFVLLLLLVFAVASALPGQAGAAPKKAWTIMVFIDGDNDLDYQGWMTLDLLAAGLSSPSALNVVALYDHYGAAGAERYLVTADGYTKVGDVAEPDMGSGASVAEFVTWAMTAYPADRYTLDLWDHGGGWMYFSRDSTSDTRMYISDLAAGMAAAEQAVGDTIDVTVFEACTMAQMEIAYQLKDVTGVELGTEVTMDAEGPPWHWICAALEDDPAIETVALGRFIADEYVRYYMMGKASGGAGNDDLIATFSSTDESTQTATAQAIDQLALALTARMRLYKSKLGSAATYARNQCFESVMGLFWFSDAWVLCDRLKKSIGDPEIDALAGQVKACIEAGTYCATSHQQDTRSHGLTLAFPPNATHYYDNYYGRVYDDVGLFFTQDTHWDEMLKAYYRTASGRHRNKS